MTTVPKIQTNDILTFYRKKRRKMTVDTMEKLYEGLQAGDFDGLTSREIADIVNASASTVQSYIRVLEAIHNGVELDIPTKYYCERTVLRYCKVHGLTYRPMREGAQLEIPQTQTVRQPARTETAAPATDAITAAVQDLVWHAMNDYMLRVGLLKPGEEVQR